MTVHNIVIVGASFAGLGTAHYLLRHTIPKLEASNTGTTYKLTLISTTDQFFFKIASPRTVAEPNKLPISKLFSPLADGFKEYPADRFELLIGTATRVDEEKKAVVVARHGGDTVTVPYGSLVAATGSKSRTPIWTLHDDPQQSVDEFKKLHEKLPEAQNILVVGGGPAGVETAGELAVTYPGKHITILSGNTQLLTRLGTTSTGAKVGKTAESQLNALGVKTVHDVKVKSTRNEGSKTIATLDKPIDYNVTELTVDVYIDATGGVRNSDWIPTSWLTSASQVSVDKITLRATSRPNIYAIGDIASYSQLAILDVNFAIRPLCSSILEDLSSSKMPATPFKQVTAPTQIVPIGPSGGVGILFGWQIPSFLVWLLKARTFFIEKVEPTVRGADYVKA